jgi:hypothetical protein
MLDGAQGLSHTGWGAGTFLYPLKTRTAKSRQATNIIQDECATLEIGE